jgi:dethiobiotin synthetase
VRLIVVTGTGTEIGKTHLTCALLRHAPRPTRAGGFKPIESGGDADARALVEASHPTFHVKHPPSPYLLRRAVSPHLAARDEGRPIDLGAVADVVDQARCLVDVLFVELAGGLFSPLGDDTTNAELVRRLAPNAILLVAPDRLGVLHDVGAVLRAFGQVTAIALVAGAAPDTSSSTNAGEIGRGTPCAARVVSVPRGPVDALARSSAIAELYACVV